MATQSMRQRGMSCHGRHSVLLKKTYPRKTPWGGQAHGYCTVTDEDGDKAFLIWQCKGQPRCEGDFQWTGGTGKYTGLKGHTNFTGIPIGSTASGYSLFKGNWQVP
jgi:hypothetical protein